MGAVPVSIVIIVYELAVYAAASLLSPLMTPDVIRELSAVGNVMILAIALNMMGLTKLKGGRLYAGYGCSYHIL